MSIDRDKLWTGTINQQALEPQTRHTVGLYDTTLRDGEQSVGVVLMPEEKLEIARALDAAGIDRIEAGFPRVSDDDWRAVELIAGAGLRAEVWGFSRAVQGGRRGARRARRQGLGDREPDLGREAGRARRLARRRCSSGSARRSRSPPATASTSRSSASTRLAPTWSSSGVRTPRPSRRARRRSSVVDTIGIATPEAAALLVGEAVDLLGHDVPVHWHGHDDFGLATAAAVAAVQAGATWVQGTINGMGERGGNADLIEVALALEALYGIPTRLDLTQARELSRLVEERAGTPLAPWKAVTGENLFVRESGAVAAQFHDPPAIEPYASELVGQERGIVLGKKSGLDSIRIKVEELGARRAGGPLRRAARRGEARRHREAGPRHRRRAPPPRGRRGRARREGAIPARRSRGRRDPRAPPRGAATPSGCCSGLADPELLRDAGFPRSEHTADTVREHDRAHVGRSSCVRASSRELAIADRADRRVPRVGDPPRLPLVGVARPRSATGCYRRRVAKAWRRGQSACSPAGRSRSSA